MTLEILKHFYLKQDELCETFLSHRFVAQKKILVLGCTHSIRVLPVHSSASVLSKNAIHCYFALFTILTIIREVFQDIPSPTCGGFIYLVKEFGVNYVPFN